MDLKRPPESPVQPSPPNHPFLTALFLFVAGVGWVDAEAAKVTSLHKLSFVPTAMTSKHTYHNGAPFTHDFDCRWGNSLSSLVKKKDPLSDAPVTPTAGSPTERDGVDGGGANSSRTLLEPFEDSATPLPAAAEAVLAAPEEPDREASPSVSDVPTTKPFQSPDLRDTAPESQVEWNLADAKQEEPEPEPATQIAPPEEEPVEVVPEPVVEVEVEEEPMPRTKELLLVKMDEVLALPLLFSPYCRGWGAATLFGGSAPASLPGGRRHREDGGQAQQPARSR
jgi:hypothetical protein